MTLKRELSYSILFTVTIGATLSCNTSRNIYRSSNSKQDYLIINALTLSHCGCTQLYIDHFKNGRIDFRFYYDDQIARKTIFQYGNSKKPIDTLFLLATDNNDFKIALDSLDIDIFKRIDTIAMQKPRGIVYAIKRPKYKGFIKDPYFNR